AVQVLGVDAVPYLLHELGAWDSLWKQLWVQSLQKARGVRFLQVDSMYDRQYRAKEGLAMLGSRGIVGLVQGMTNANENVRRECAFAMIFPEFSFYSLDFIPHLQESLKDPSSRVRAQAATTLSLISTNPTVVVPPLIDLLGDSDRWVQVAAADGLG